MAPDDPYLAFLERIRAGADHLAQLKARSLAGLEVSPDDVKLAYDQAHANVTELAQFLGIDKPHMDDEAVDPAGLEAYDQAVEVCMGVTRLSLDMARLHGPAYLIVQF